MSPSRRFLGLEHEVALILAETSVAGEAYPKVLATVGSSLDWDFGAAWEERLDLSGFVRCAATLFASSWITLKTSRGDIAAEKIAIVAAGHNSVLAAMAGVRLPLQSHPLQALVSEPVKPVLDCVVMSNTVHVYVSQSDKGELVIGAGIDAFNSYTQRGSFPIIEGQMAALLELFPSFSRLKMLRSWAGIVDVSPDASPIIGKVPVEGLYLNGGWGTGGFKATPGAGHVFAHTIAHDEPHPLARPFALDRFMSGALIDEHGAAAVAH